MTDAPRYWKPLIKQRPDQMYRRPQIVQETMQHYGIDWDAANAKLDAEDAKCDYFLNHLYQVQTQLITANLGAGAVQLLHLCVRRIDGAPVHDWRHLQQIKNELAGPEHEAFEIYPRESRKVDTSNKYHLWVLPNGVEFSIGWSERDVQDETVKGVPGLRQRAL